ncbi:amino acid ABC transporter permease [Granulosicoccus antarcticus]|uniref:Inner membrane amino-acid ABC transporter permease protein YhdY n=1 Tax=Granulosicoccus antarcticus IMCC3135 TaxID=1192854 RepID=A0A2Z2NRM3_9GAMM|nr:amino acid ABC transporter permease [Granulosicoccus antarcticus]ASJ73155.1 Inner membrane amino-acid ABC transporter permease protein YhdY [Granulosicoccus antarcticus IMCC3135]
MKKRAFATPTDAVLSIIIFGGLAYALWLALDWAVFRAVWSKENVAACGEAVGACWSVIDARHRLILFGLYPYEEHWRSTLACLAIVATVVVSCFPWSWKTARLSTLWVAGFALYYLLMTGTLLGLPTVTTDQWGGLALTLFLFASVVLIGMPMGLGLALMRRSEMPVVRLLASLLIDFIRSLPLLTTLFTAAVVFPLLLPDWLQGDKIWRVIFAFALFFACYQAEVFRGGFQAIPKGQFEAGKALGLGYWKILFNIVLPQVFRQALPSTINMVVITFKETAIVIIIGFFDVLASANAAFGTGEWSPYYMEVYAFVAALYWLFIFSLGQYGEYLGKRMSVAQR